MCCFKSPLSCSGYEYYPTGWAINKWTHTRTHALTHFPTVKIWTRTRQLLISMGEQLRAVLNKCWGNKVPSSPHQHTHDTHRHAHTAFMGDSMSCMSWGHRSPESVAVKEPHCSGLISGTLKHPTERIARGSHVTWQTEPRLFKD